LNPNCNGKDCLEPLPTQEEQLLGLPAKAKQIFQATKIAIGKFR